MSSPDRGHIALVTWAHAEPTGGNVYNARLAAALEEQGRVVEIVTVPGSWPDADREAHERLAAELSTRPMTLVDGIVASHAPEAIEAASGAGRIVVILVHLPLGVEEPDSREAEALRAAAGVVCTSRHGAELIMRHYGVRAAVALPGAERAPVATGSRPPQLLSVASLTPIKDQLTIVRALTMIRDLDWSAALVGSTSADPDYVDQVRTMIDSGGLASRIEITGTVVGASLEEQWAAADLLLLVSRTETYGMVVTEAFAHGIPAVVGAGTGAEEALRRTDDVTHSGAGEALRRTDDVTDPGALPGRTVPAGDPAALAAALRVWLSDAGLRTAWRASALERRASLPAWADAATAVERGVTAVTAARR